jgi:hypothetical protein
MNTGWTVKNYTPAFSNTVQSTKAVRHIYSLADARYGLKIGQAYSKSPDKWESEDHILLREPHPNSELKYHTHSLYGCETLSRVQFPGSPMAYNFHVSTSSLQDDLMAEEVEVSQDYDIERYLISKHSSFLFNEDEQSKISCPTCIPKFPDRERVQLSKFNRDEYIAHYRSKHTADIAYVGLAFLTGLNGRIYEAFSLYMMALTANHLLNIPKDRTDHGYVPKTRPYRGIQDALCGGVRRARRPSYGRHEEEIMAEPRSPRAARRARLQAEDLPPGVDIADDDSNNPPSCSKGDRIDDP